MRHLRYFEFAFAVHDYALIPIVTILGAAFFREESMCWWTTLMQTWCWLVSGNMLWSGPASLCIHIWLRGNSFRVDPFVARCIYRRRSPPHQRLVLCFTPSRFVFSQSFACLASSSAVSWIIFHENETASIILCRRLFQSINVMIVLAFTVILHVPTYNNVLDGSSCCVWVQA